jgi:Asp-tRNA(Asn)/Glu-tRNA(Gln) amidotransferase A subunit family amidase
LPPLRDALIGYSDWLGYGHGERAEAWLQRLEVNRPELEAFRAAGDCPYGPYAPRATTVAPARGIGGSAASLPADASGSLARARAASHLNAFTWLPERLPAAGVGLLAGVPIVVKDLMAVEGAPLSGGGRAWGRDASPRDAEVVARLKRAGAVVVGLANLHEFAYGITSDNPHFGRVMNPAARDRIPGGSSGGTAAAIAAGIVELGLGTDTAGSIRIPAACCGVVGFKPSYDALPREGVMDLAPTLDHVGPMARSVEGAAALFAAMLDLPSQPPWRFAGLSGQRVVRLRGYFEDPLDSEVRRALDEAQQALQAHGARVTDGLIEGIELAGAIQFNTICPEATAVHADRLEARGPDYGEDVRVRLEIGHFLPGPWYVKAQRMRARLVASIESGFADADFLLCATLRVPAPAVGAARVAIGGAEYPLHTAMTQLTLPFNLAGLPAISVPWGKSRDGVPICLQLVAARGADWALLGAAARLESLSPYP